MRINSILLDLLGFNFGSLPILQLHFWSPLIPQGTNQVPSRLQFWTPPASALTLVLPPVPILVPLDYTPGPLHLALYLHFPS